MAVSPKGAVGLMGVIPGPALLRTLLPLGKLITIRATTYWPAPGRI